MRSSALQRQDIRGIETTSVARSADRTRFWSVGAIVEHVPSGAAGEGSSASKSCAA